MHHSLRFYVEHQHGLLKLYISLARLTRIPLIGRLVRHIANTYGQREHNVYSLTLDEAEQIIDASTKVALGPCACRHVFHNCDSPAMGEILVGNDTIAFPQLRNYDYRDVSKEEAKAVLKECHDKRLTHTLAKCRGSFYAICNCCDCCCVPMRLRRDYGIENALVRNRNVVEDFIKKQL